MLPTSIDTKDVETYQEEIEDLHDFYDLSIDRSKMVVSKIFLNRLKIRDKLIDMGFCRYDTEDSYRLVRIKDNKISLTTDVQISDEFEDYIVALPDRNLVIESNDETNGERLWTIKPTDILDVLYKNFNSYLNIFERLRHNKPIELQEDTPYKKYIYFKNCVIEVNNKGDIKPLDYTHIKKMVWESSILEHDFFYTEKKGMFETFFNNITGKDEERKQSLMSLIGYLLHANYECEKRMVVLTDVNMENPDKPTGGTGKGILGKAISHMLNKTTNDVNYVAIAGKTFDGSDPKKYITADINTKVIHVEDAEIRRLSSMYNDITDGASIRKHHQAPFTVFLKLMISINQTILLDSVSDRRRLWIFELENYYNENFNPESEFGCRFFENKWSNDDWNEFYSFMIRCVQLYMTKGVLLVEDINYANREIIEHTNENFAYWFSDYIEEYVELKKEKELIKPHIFSFFNNKYPEYISKNWYSQTHFTKWCKIFLEKKNIPFCEIRSTNDLIILYPTKETAEKARKAKRKL